MCNFNPAEEGGLPSAERGGDERSEAGGVRTSSDFFKFVVSACLPLPPPEVHPSGEAAAKESFLPPSTTAE